MVRTPPFHGGNMGSNPVGVTTFKVKVEDKVKNEVKDKVKVEINSMLNLDLNLNLFCIFNFTQKKDK